VKASREAFAELYIELKYGAAEQTGLIQITRRLPTISVLGDTSIHADDDVFPVHYGVRCVTLPLVVATSLVLPLLDS
jgi:hypothetical protein